MNYEANFEALGSEIPSIEPSVPPDAQFVLYRQVGNLLTVSGYGPFQGAAIPPEFTGKVGEQLTVQQGYKAARLTAINLLLIVRQALGTLNRVAHVVEVTGLVNCPPDFTQQPAVINGCSDLLIQVFGENGRHVRTAAGANALAFDISIEISISLLVNDAPMPNPTTPSPNVGDALLHYLSLEQVTHVFGIPGGGLSNLLTSFKNVRDKITYVVCRQETGAAYIADGYYRATGKLGVVMVTSGPGATNALTGVMNAQNDGSAMLLITGEVAQQYFGLGYLQEGIDARLDVDALYSAACSYSAMLEVSDDAETIMKQALRDALSIPRRAVHISVPNNVTLEPLPTPPQFPASTSSYRAVPGGVALEEVEKAMAALTAAKHPLIFLGNGCREALRPNRNEFIRFVETYGIPVVTTADGKGIFPESHPLSLRVYGVADCMWPHYWLTAPASGINAYDGLLVIGSSLGGLSTNNWLPMLQPPANSPLIQVDMDQSVIGRSFPITHGIVGEAGAFMRGLEQLIPQFPPDPKAVATRKAAVARIKADYSPYKEPDQYTSTADPIEPAALMRVLQNILPADQVTKLFVDAGNCVGWAVHYLVVDPPWAIHSALSMGPMGFGVGAVIGAKIGMPDATCLAIVGDGAFMMHGAEVSTARQHGVGAIWIVLNDNNLSMVSQGMAFFSPDDKDPNVWKDLYELGNPDLVKFAEGLGADAYLANDESTLEAIMPLVLKRANIECKPQVVVVNINSQSVPPYYDPDFMLPKKP